MADNFSKRPVGQAVKTPPFHGGNMGSIPVRVTKNNTTHQGGVIFLFKANQPDFPRSTAPMPAKQSFTTAGTLPGGRVAPRCRWQIKRGISVCSGRRGTKACLPRTFAGYRKRTGQKRSPPRGRAYCRRRLAAKRSFCVHGLGGDFWWFFIIMV